MILEMETDAQILSTRDVMRQLRPHIEPEQYLPTIRRLMRTEGYRLAAAVDDGVVRAVAGYRCIEMLYCGRALVIDDLVTDAASRSRGHGKALLAWLSGEATRHGCTQLHLDSRVHRERAHQFYIREGFTITCFHFCSDVRPVRA